MKAIRKLIFITRLATAHETRLFRQAVSLCGNTQSAEDLCAETLIEAWKSLPRFRGGCQFSTWLYGILLHRHQKALRRARSRPPSMTALSRPEAEAREDHLIQVPVTDPGAAEHLAQRETSQALRTAIERLPQRHQAVILMRFFEGAQLGEIAAALGIPVGTVKSRLHHALDALRQMQDTMNLPPLTGDVQT